MKKITLLILLLLAFDFGYGQTTLAEGDIAITGVNADNNDQFAFVLLIDVTSGTTINFTDTGWFAVGGFRGYNATTGITGEGIVTWTATSALTCGTVVVIEQTGTNIHTATNGTAVEAADIGFNLATLGDQLLAFQGSTADPTFIYAVHYANSNGWTDATGTNDSAVPAGLTDGINAINIGNLDNAAYNCSIASDQSAILAAVGDSANWNGSNSIRQTLGSCVFTCAAAGTCSGISTTWDGTNWDNGTPDLTMPAILNEDYNSLTNGDLRACSLIVNPTFRLTVDNKSFVEVEHDVIVDGELFVETQGNFVQNDNAGTFTVNAGGVARVTKETASKADWFYYTYWSSPVESITISNAFPDVDGDRRFWFNAANFVDTNGDDIDDNGDDWQYALAANTMSPGVGYAVTESRFFFGGSGTADFEGPFNTRDVPVNITSHVANTGTRWNFIGNPYPSAIDFIAFQSANSAVVDGAAYFWSQATPHSESNGGNQQSNFSKNDYATYTVGTGGVAGGGPDIPNQYIPSGQGFFIPAITNGTATFTNAMRMADGTSNTQFFKNSSTKKKSSAIENRLWVNLTSDNGIFNQILVGYVDGATNGKDGLSYDAPKLISLDYSTLLYTSMEENNKKYVVQGKDVNSINEDEIINLGFSTNIDVATLYKLSIAQLEGDFLTGNPIYVKDNLLNQLHDLSASDYTFTSEVGEFNERFEIVFNAAALSTDDVALNSKSLKIIELEDDYVQFTTSDNLSIKAVKIFDLLGRQLYNFKGNNSTETYMLSDLSSTVYIAKVELSNGAIVTKKAIKQ